MAGSVSGWDSGNSGGGGGASNAEDLQFNGIVPATQPKIVITEQFQNTWDDELEWEFYDTEGNDPINGSGTYEDLKTALRGAGYIVQSNGDSNDDAVRNPNTGEDYAVSLAVNGDTFFAFGENEYVWASTAQEAIDTLRGDANYLSNRAIPQIRDSIQEVKDEAVKIINTDGLTGQRVIWTGSVDPDDTEDGYTPQPGEPWVEGATGSGMDS